MTHTPRLHPDLPLAAEFFEVAVAKMPELAEELERWYIDGRDGGWHRHRLGRVNKSSPTA